MKLIKGYNQYTMQLIQESEWFMFMSKTGIILIDLYENFALTLFILLIWLVSKSIQVIIDEVKTPFTSIYGSAYPQLMKWKRNCCLISNCFTEVNAFFGTFLFLYIGKTLIIIYEMFLDLIMICCTDENQNVFAMVYTLTVDLIRLFMVIIASHTARKKVS